MEKNNDWILDKIELEFQSWGKDKGKYIGSIRFKNGEFESFQFKIRPDMAQAYIDLMANDIVKCASDLGERLIASLGLEKNKLPKE